MNDPFEKVVTSVFVGPSVWWMLKCYAANYEPTAQNKRDFKQLIELSLKLFPCEVCSEHAMTTFRNNDIDNYLQNKDRLYLYISGVLQDSANDNKQVPMDERPNYYDAKRFIFESMHGECPSCHK